MKRTQQDGIGGGAVLVVLSGQGVQEGLPEHSPEVGGNSSEGEEKHDDLWGGAQ